MRKDKQHARENPKQPKRSCKARVANLASSFHPCKGLLPCPPEWAMKGTPDGSLRGWDNIHNGGGYVDLGACNVAAFALAKLAELRATEQVLCSSTTPLVLRATKRGKPLEVAWATDELYICVARCNCVVALLQALLARSAADLGISNDVLVSLNPTLVTYSMVLRMVARARECGAPFGALELPRRTLQHGLSELMQLAEGVYMLTGYLLRGGVFHRHAIGFNAGSSLFYVNPAVVAVTADDRRYPALFFSRLCIDHGLFVPEQRVVRRLAINVTHSSWHVLPYAAQLPRLCAAASPTQQGKRKRKAHRGLGKRKRVL